jgi:hypothetical protein
VVCLCTSKICDFITIYKSPVAYLSCVSRVTGSLSIFDLVQATPEPYPHPRSAIYCKIDINLFTVGLSYTTLASMRSTPGLNLITNALSAFNSSGTCTESSPHWNKSESSVMFSMTRLSARVSYINFRRSEMGSYCTCEMLKGGVALKVFVGASVL